MNGWPAVILLNAGRLHRVGPHRLYVRIARQLAEIGFCALRFDLTGIGDSEIRRDDLRLEQAVVHEARLAMDHVSKATGLHRFVTLGLCEGARSAFRVAVADPRVVGVLMIDGYAYRTFGFHWRHFAHFLRRQVRRVGALVHLEGWRRLVARMARAAEGARAEAGSAVEEDEPFPPKDALLGDIRALLARNARLFFVYTSGGMYGFYNYESQLMDAFPCLRATPQVRVKYMGRTDHTFTLLRHQEELLSAIRDWVATEVASAGPR